MQATRLNKPILHTDDVRFCLLWGAEKGEMFIRGDETGFKRGAGYFRYGRISMCVTAFASSLKACSNLGERLH